MHTLAVPLVLLTVAACAEHRAPQLNESDYQLRVVVRASTTSPRSGEGELTLIYAGIRDADVCVQAWRYQLNRSQQQAEVDGIYDPPFEFTLRPGQAHSWVWPVKTADEIFGHTDDPVIYTFHLALYQGGCSGPKRATVNSVPSVLELTNP
jgi:hypothetical protein